MKRIWNAIGTISCGAVLLAVLSFRPATAQTFMVLRSFSAANTSNGTNDDGAKPWAGVTVAGGTLYGTTVEGGASNSGVVFAVGTNGTGFTTLKHFAGSAGEEAYAGLTISGSTLFGATVYGGSANFGTLFRMNVNGTGYTVLKSFAGFPDEGAWPNASPSLSGNALFGTTEFGGTGDAGTVFRINTDGTHFAVLKAFPALSFADFPHANSEGAYPVGGLTLSGNTLYGVTYQGGHSGGGTVFRMTTNGTGFTVLKAFPQPTAQGGPNSDGANPFAKLLLSGNALYGTTTWGGSAGLGTVFRMETNGMGFVVLKHFAGSDGMNPFSSLTLHLDSLYGTTAGGGNSGNGTVFRMNTNGESFAVLMHFPATLNNTNSEGANPYAGLALAGKDLYGTTFHGGSAGNGTLFKLSILPELRYQRAGNQLVLRWTDSTYGLQTAPTVNGVYTNIPGAISPSTNRIGNTPQFFRLRPY